MGNEQSSKGQKSDVHERIIPKGEKFGLYMTFQEFKRVVLGYVYCANPFCGMLVKPTADPLCFYCDRKLATELCEVGEKKP